MLKSSLRSLAWHEMSVLDILMAWEVGLCSPMNVKNGGDTVKIKEGGQAEPGR